MNDQSITGEMRPDVAQLLAEMRAVRSEMASSNGEISLAPGEVRSVSESERVDFGQLLTSAIDQVNAVQKESGQLANAYQAGDPDVTLAQVVIASEKAGVAFEAMTEIRNRLVNAYEDIMNMPI